jgi:hypothetical protein
LHPGKIRVVRYGPFDQIVRDGIKKGLDVQIYDPIELPAIAYALHPPHRATTAATDPSATSRSARPVNVRK